jgi:TatD DNase family protein
LGKFQNLACPILSILTKPQCEMRPSHASAKFLKDAPSLPKAVKKEKWVKGNMVKGRNEPVSIPHVAYAIAQIKGITVEEVCEA